MANTSFKREFFIGKETEYGGTTGVPERKFALDIEIERDVEFDDVENQSDGSRSRIADSIKTGHGSTVSITGRWFAEHTPFFTSVLLGGVDSNQLTKTIPDSGATDPDQVAQYVSSVPTREEALPDNYSLFYTDGDETMVIRGLTFTDLTITGDAGAVATITLNGRGHYAIPYTTNYVTPIEIPNRTPVVVNNQTTVVGTTSLVKTVKRTTIRIESGMTEELYADNQGGFDTQGEFAGKRICEIQLRTNNNADAKAIRDRVTDGEKTNVSITFQGVNIRTVAPPSPRSTLFKMYGQLTDQGSLYEDDNGQIVNNFTISSRPSPMDRDMEVTTVVANDDGGIV